VAARTPEPDDRDLPEPDDDSALSWEGDEALGRATSLTGRGPAREVPAARERTAAAEQTDPTDPLGVEDDDLDADLVVEPQRRDRPLLAITVLFGIVYLAYEVAWILAIQGAGGTLAASSGGAFEVFLANVTNFLALLAAALWFVVTVHLTRGGRRIHRIGFLALGLGLLVPWPFVSGLLR
jgi:hypothetical protein